MTERTKGVITLSILQLINAAGVCAVGILVLLADGGWVDPNVVRTTLGSVIGVVFVITLYAAIVLGITGDLTIVIVFMFVIWGILGLFTTVGLSKLRRWALWLTPIFNIALIVSLIVSGMARFWISFWVIIPILVLILLVVVRGEFG